MLREADRIAPRTGGTHPRKSAEAPAAQRRQLPASCFAGKPTADRTRASHTGLGHAGVTARPPGKSRSKANLRIIDNPSGVAVRVDAVYAFRKRARNAICVCVLEDTERYGL